MPGFVFLLSKEFLGLVLLAVALTVGFQAIRAALVDPVDALRHA